MRIAFLIKNFTDGDDMSEYVKSLAEYAADQGHEPFVISFDDQTEYTVSESVEVERFQLHFEGNSLYTWTMMMNNEMKGKVIEKMEDKEIDILHANDWTTAPGGITLSKHLDTPFFLTIHSTENQRGFNEENSELISKMEWQGSFEADIVFVNNHDVKNSLLFDLELPGEKVCVADPLQKDWPEKILNHYHKILNQKKAEVEA